MWILLSLILVTILLVLAILMGISNGVNKSEDEIYLTDKHKEIEEGKSKK